MATQHIYCYIGPMYWPSHWNIRRYILSLFSELVSLRKAFLYCMRYIIMTDSGLQLWSQYFRGFIRRNDRILPRATSIYGYLFWGARQIKPTTGPKLPHTFTCILLQKLGAFLNIRISNCGLIRRWLTYHTSHSMLVWELWFPENWASRRRRNFSHAWILAVY
jgi:hypothetical protein